MTTNVRGLASLWGFVMGGMIVGFPVRLILYLATFLVFGDRSEMRAIEKFASSESFVSPVVLFGFVGLWIGLRRVPNLGKLTYPLATILSFLILAYPTWHFARAHHVHTTAEAAARANVTTWEFQGCHFDLGRFTVGHYRGASFEVTTEGRVIGEVFVSPLFGFFWKSDDHQLQENADCARSTMPRESSRGKFEERAV